MLVGLLIRLRRTGAVVHMVGQASRSDPEMRHCHLLSGQQGIVSRAPHTFILASGHRCLFANPTGFYNVIISMLKCSVDMKRFEIASRFSNVIRTDKKSTCEFVMNNIVKKILSFCTNLSVVVPHGRLEVLLVHNNLAFHQEIPRSAIH